MKPIAAAVAALALAGCSMLYRQPETILVPCKVPEVTKPVFPFDTVAEDADIFTKVKNLLADRKVRQGYEGQLEASNEACRR